MYHPFKVTEQPVHYSEIHWEGAVLWRIDEIQKELNEIESTIPARIVFLAEALGGVVDLETGMVKLESDRQWEATG